MRNYSRLLERRASAEKIMRRQHKESTTLNYHAGFTLGYVSGQVNVLEDCAEDINELKNFMQQAVWRIEDMLMNDDGQAWKEAKKFLDILKNTDIMESLDIKGE